MRPGKIVNTRVHNLQIAETQIELAEIVEVALAERTAVLRSELLGKGLDELRTILRTGFAVLLFFHDAPTDVPIGEHGKLANGGVSLFAPLLYDALDVGHEMACGRGMLLYFILRHIPTFLKRPTWRLCFSPHRADCFILAAHLLKRRL